jgi:hypothetical protein
METIQIKECKDFGKLMEMRKDNLKEIMGREVQEIIENEFDLLEFNLFISSFGKEKIDEATKKVSELRKKVGKGEIDLSKYEDMADDF